MIKYKSFRKQLLECKENGNLLDNECCPKCSQKLLICEKYGGQCISKKCLSERIKED